MKGEGWDGGGFKFIFVLKLVGVLLKYRFLGILRYIKLVFIWVGFGNSIFENFFLRFIYRRFYINFWVGVWKLRN